MEQDIIQKLKLSGLTQREAHIYLALLQKKEFAASEIASIAPVGRTKIYEIIPRLIKMGFCTEVQKDGKKIYSAVEPKIALDNILAEFEQELKVIYRKKEQLLSEKKNIVSGLQTDLDEVYFNNSRKTDGLDYIEVLKDLNQIKSRWVDLQENTKYEMLGFNKLPYSMSYDETVKYQKKMLKRKKMKSRGIYEYGDIITLSSATNFFSVVEHFSSMGEECRVIDKIPMKMMIIDEKIVMLALNDTVSMKPSITTMIVEHPSFAAAQKKVFETYWREAVPFEEFKKNKESILNKKN